MYFARRNPVYTVSISVVAGKTRFDILCDGAPTPKFFFSQEKADAFIAKQGGAPLSSHVGTRAPSPAPAPAPEPEPAPAPAVTPRAPVVLPKPDLSANRRFVKVPEPLVEPDVEIHQKTFPGGMVRYHVGKDVYGHASEEKALKEADRRKRRYDRFVAMMSSAVLTAQSGVPRFGLPLGKASPVEQEAYLAPLMPDIAMEDFSPYSIVDIMRLLDRADASARRFKLRMLARMLERQTEIERRAADAQVENETGFSKPDSATAEQLYGQASRLGEATPEAVLYFDARLADLLATYARRQLQEFMNDNGKLIGKKARTNRGR